MGSISGSVKLQFSQKITAGRNQFQSPLDLPTSNQITLVLPKTKNSEKG